MARFGEELTEIQSEIAGTAPSGNKYIFLYLTMIFLVTLSDAVMSYLSPVYINNVYNDTFAVGLILAISSSCGFFFDLFVSTRLRHKSFRFFTKYMVIFSIVFPLSFLLLPHIFFTFALGMVVWAIYYEMRGYSNFHYVQHTVKVSQHAKMWGFILTTQYIAYFIGPLIATSIDTQWDRLPLLIAVISTTLGCFIFYSSKYFKAHQEVKEAKVYTLNDLVKEFRAMNALVKRTFFFLLFSFTLILIDVSFWTMGALYSQELMQKSELGKFFISMYGIQGLYCGILASKANLFGKKKTSFLIGIVVGLMMIGISITDSVYKTLLLVMGVSALYGICIILISAVFEDYVSRLHETSNYMISLEQMIANMAYVIGPIGLGWVGQTVGVKNTFGVVGIVIMIASACALVFVPKKIKMPQAELKSIEQ